MIRIKPVQSIASLLVIAASLTGNQLHAAGRDLRPVAVSMQEQPPPWTGGSIPVSRPLQHRAPAQAQRPAVMPFAQRMRLAAQRGHPKAQYDLGLAYQTGRHGFQRDVRQAKHWFHRSALGGEAAAQYALAQMFQKGALGHVDMPQALHWQHEAAKRGHTEAQYQLGMAHLNGHNGAKVDPPRGQFWLKEAAKRGHRSAQLAMNRQRAAPPPVQLASIQQPVMPRAMPAPPRPQYQPQPAPQPRYVQPTPHPRMPQAAPRPAVNPQLAQRLRQTAESTGAKINLQGMNPNDVRALAETGDRYAQFLMGALHEDGAYGMQKSYREAARWYRRAAKQRYAKAQYNLALLYEDGKGVSQDYRTASNWYQQAVQGGSAEAKNNLGVLYVLGKGVPRDARKAESLFTQAAQSGNPDAVRNLQRLRGR